MTGQSLLFKNRVALERANRFLRTLNDQSCHSVSPNQLEKFLNRLCTQIAIHLNRVSGHTTCRANSF